MLPLMTESIPAMPSWKLAHVPAQPLKQRHSNPPNCRCSDRPTETTVLLQKRI